MTRCGLVAASFLEWQGLLQECVDQRRGAGLVEVRVLVGHGGMLDAGEPPGLASFMWAMLMEGTEGLDAVAINALRKRVGATLQPTALSALANQLRPSLALLAEVLRRPAFREEYAAHVKPRLLARIAQAQTESSLIAGTVASELLFGCEHPYGVHGAGLGTRTSIEAMDMARLRRFHEEIIRPDNLQIFAAGDVEFGELLKAPEGTFGDWIAPSRPRAARSIPRVVRPAVPRLALVHRSGAEQSFLLGAIVSSAPGGDYPIAHRMANGVFGGQFSSRLNMNLREDKHWTYGAYSTLTNDVVQGRLSLAAAVQSDKSAAALAEMIAEVCAIASERPPSSSEIERVKASEVRVLPARFETAAAVADALVDNAVNRRPDDYVQRLKRNIEATSSNEITAAASDLFCEDSMTWVVVGDLREIEASVRRIGIADVALLQAEHRSLQAAAT